MARATLPYSFRLYPEDMEKLREHAKNLNMVQANVIRLCIHQFDTSPKGTKKATDNLATAVDNHRRTRQTRQTRQAKEQARQQTEESEWDLGADW
jgi:hypothetical protein